MPKNFGHSKNIFMLRNKFVQLSIPRWAFPDDTTDFSPSLRITEIAWISSQRSIHYSCINCRMMIWSCNKREFCEWRNRMRRIDIVICVLRGPEWFQCLCSTLLLLCTGVLQVWSVTHSRTKRELEEKFAKKTRRRSRSLRSGRATI
jgi:hypothetical protein